MSFRKQQLNSLIRNEVAKAIQREVEFPAGALVSVTEVRVSDDLAHADVMISVLPSAKKDAALKALNAKQSEIQTILFKKIKIMSLPKVRFNYDPGPEKAADIERISLGGK
ncbi:MAG: 30S ribosome-binding factor RbfA [Parcubacteria group bacterium]